MNNPTPGRRLRFDEPDLLPIHVEKRMEPGDYWKFDPHDLWLVRAPNGDIGSINNEKWKITEHADGTITVQPSIQFYSRDEKPKQGWHGYLVNGQWRSC